MAGMAMDGDQPPAKEQAAAYHDLFTSYLAIQAALAGDTTTGVGEMGKSLMAALHPLVGKGVTSDQMKRVHAELAGLASHDLARVRGAFGPISEVILEVAAGPAKPVAEKLGLAAYHCPMSHANWLQKGELANPYFGASMLRCGEPLAGK
jgi:hypothetical protein